VLGGVYGGRGILRKVGNWRDGWGECFGGGIWGLAEGIWAIVGNGSGKVAQV